MTEPVRIVAYKRAGSEDLVFLFLFQIDFTLIEVIAYNKVQGFLHIRKGYINENFNKYKAGLCRSTFWAD